MLRSTKLLGLLLISLFLVSVFNSSQAYAVSGSDWQAGNIIDDSIFYDNSSMSTSQIQSFLNSKVPTCDTNGTQPYGGTTRADYGTSRGYPPPYTCLKDYTQNGKSAAQIIKEAANTYSINPKALLVLLQKEQTLVTDDWPWSSQYRAATGYGCPDTAPCDSEYYGFTNQVTKAAFQFRRYANYPNDYRYKPYQNNTIQYNPNSSCGSSTVYIENKATAGLYNYTPYQPNTSALNNLYGSGDSCGAYGNRNFWRLFNDWFGTTYAGQIPGGLRSRVSAISQAYGKINVFVKGTDGRLWQKWFSGGHWSSGWNYIDGPNGNSSSPSAITFNDGHMDVFEVQDGKLRHNWYNADPTAWRGWSTLGSPKASGGLTNPTALSQTYGKINVFARGKDGRLWQRWFENGHWSSSWNYIDGPTYNASVPAAVSFGNGHMDVFEVKDGQVRHKWYKNDSTAWRPWSSLGSPNGVRLKTQIAAVSQSSGKINLFARGKDGRLWQRWFENGHWSSSWNYIQGPTSGVSTPGAISFKNGHMDVFQVQDNRLWHAWYKNDSTAWRPWSRLF